MSNGATAIEEMIQSYIDEQDSNAEQHTDQCVSDLKSLYTDVIVNVEELQSRITSLEAKTAPAAEEQDENLLQELADSAPRAVNQIDWIMTTHNLIAGYDSKAMLESYVRSVLPADQTHQAEMIIAMTLTTARNIINKKLEAES